MLVCTLQGQEKTFRSPTDEQLTWLLVALEFQTLFSLLKRDGSVAKPLVLLEDAVNGNPNPAPEASRVCLNVFTVSDLFFLVLK